MKKLLITGSNGFVGSYFIDNYKNKYNIKTFSFLKECINRLDCKNIDVVFHLSALVHQMGGASAEEYEKINVTQTLELAKNKNVKIIGTTTHQVDEIVDNGKILTQSCICIDWDKDILIEDVIFKSGCVCLLNALLLEINTKNLEVYSLNLNQKNVIISPPLCFDISKINNEFWNKIKLLS